MHPLYRIKFDAFCLNNKLTIKQKDCLIWLLRGKQQKEIAIINNVGFHTIREHCSKMYKKFNITNQGEMLAKYIEYLGAQP